MKPEITVIAAVARNGVIGKDGDIPWRIKEDFARFKEKTWGHPCIMGEKTYKSLPKNARPLPGRENIVLTFDRNFKEPGITTMYSFEDALKHCEGKEKVFITGGASIYKLGLEVADTLELTRIHKDFEGDTYFPVVDFDDWEEVSRQDMEHEKHGAYSFITYKRKK